MQTFGSGASRDRTGGLLPRASGQVWVMARLGASTQIRGFGCCYGTRSGPRSLVLATLAVRNRVSRGDTVELCSELFGARISRGSVNGSWSARLSCSSCQSRLLAKTAPLGLSVR